MAAQSFLRTFIRDNPLKLAGGILAVTLGGILVVPPAVHSQSTLSGAPVKARTSPITRAGEITTNEAGPEPSGSLVPVATVVSRASGLSASTSLRFVIGDKLKVSIFEEIDRAGAQSVLVERTDLSGIYTVQADGAIYLPFAGALSIAMLSEPEAVRTLVEHASRAISVGRLTATVVVQDREPVYVMTGRGSLPGTSFRHTPGMLVAHALALAGGDPASGDMWKRIDIARERERMHRATERLARNLALVDVLAAELAGSDRAEPTGHLQSLAGQAASDLVTTIADARRREIERDEFQLAGLSRIEAVMRANFTEHHERLQHLSDAIAERSKRRDSISNRVAAGTSQEIILDQARRDLAETQSRWYEARSQIAQFETRLAEIARERDLLRATRRIEVDQRLATARAAIAEDEAAIATVGQFLVQVDSDDDSKSAARRSVKITILRRTSAGLIELLADERTSLQPGDLVQWLRS